MASGDASEATNSAGPDLMAAFVQTFERRQTRRAYRHDLQAAFGRSTLCPSDLAAVSANTVTLRVWGPDSERTAETEPAETEPAETKPDAKAPSPAQRRRQAAVKGFLLWLREPPQQEALRDTGAAQVVQALSAPLGDDSTSTTA